jgi:hypothetical protein
MQAIEVDPAHLRRRADIAMHVSAQSAAHLEAERKGEVAAVLDTLVAEGPYAWCVPVASVIHADDSSEPAVSADGAVRLPFASSFEGIEQWYGWIHRRHQLRGLESLIEYRGDWYTFHEGIAPVIDKATGLPNEGLTIALFPSSIHEGITGELVWGRVPREMLGVGANGTTGDMDQLALRRQVVRQFHAYLAALRTADVEGILAVLSEDAQALMRDYVNDTGTLAELHGKAAHRAYYERLFDKFDVDSIELLHWIAQDWYVFSELRVTVRVKKGDAAGDLLAFHLAESLVPGNDGKFVVRIGHGTDPAPATHMEFVQTNDQPFG